MEAHLQDLALRLEEHDVRLYCPVMEALGAQAAAAAPYAPLLQARLEAPERRVRASACGALGRLQQAALAPSLALRLEEDRAMEVKLAAVEALNRLASEAPEQIARHSNQLASHMIMDEAGEEASILGPFWT